MRALKPVSSEVDQIRAQQKDFGELRRRTLEPLGQNVAQCNRVGQALVRSALQGVATNQLEKDLEKMNDKWNALKEKVGVDFVGLGEGAHFYGANVVRVFQNMLMSHNLYIKINAICDNQQQNAE